MKIKTSGATPIQIDWAVAKCEGLRTYVEVVEGFKPSTDWMQGGPIIEREGINVRWCIREHDGSLTLWSAEIRPIDLVTRTKLDIVRETGDTPLIAAMRCYVASKLGDEIEIPEELK